MVTFRRNQCKALLYIITPQTERLLRCYTEDKTGGDRYRQYNIYLDCQWSHQASCGLLHFKVKIKLDRIFEEIKTFANQVSSSLQLDMAYK